jgi:hypothetical protein
MRLGNLLRTAGTFTLAAGLWGPGVKIAKADLTYVVLYSGGISQASNYPRYYQQMNKADQIFSTLFGANNVYVLFADGQTNTQNQSNNAMSPFPDVVAGNLFEATDPYLEDVLETDIPSAAEGQPYSLIFYSFDHGGPVTDNSTTSVELLGWNPLNNNPNANTTNAELSSYVTYMDDNSHPIAELFDFNECYSNGMANGPKGVLATGSDVFAMWAASYCSFGDGFSNAFLNAVQSGLTSTYAIGQAAVNNDPFGPNGTRQDAPGYAGYSFDILTNEQVPEPSAILLLAVLLLALCGATATRSAARRLRRPANLIR